MPCLKPVHIPVYKLEPQFRKCKKLVNGSLVDSRSGGLVKVKHYIEVPCGKCPACLSRAQAEWQFRIEQEVLDPRVVQSLFVTLTYAPKFLPSDHCVSKVDAQRYLKRLRVNCDRFYGCSVGLRYYLCGEYGELRLRPHYHAILTFRKSVDWSFIVNSWSRGFVDIAPFTPARAGYVAKYSLKQYGVDYSGLSHPFRLCSKGLGRYFLQTHSAKSLSYDARFSNLSGRSVSLHRYYKNKLFPNYVYFYSTVDTSFGKVRVSERRLSSNHRNYCLYRSESQRRYDKFFSNGVTTHQDGFLGFLNHQSLSRPNQLSFYDFSLIEKQKMRYAY